MKSCTAASATHSGRPLAAVRLTQPRDIRTRQRPPTCVRSHCRFRNRGTDYLSEPGMKRMSSGTKRQCDRAADLRLLERCEHLPLGEPLRRLARERICVRMAQTMQVGPNDAGWPTRCKLAQTMQVGPHDTRLARTFRWEHSDKRLKLAQLLGQLGVFLALAESSAAPTRTAAALRARYCTRRPCDTAASSASSCAVRSVACTRGWWSH
jgi:hypothetical protein